MKSIAYTLAALLALQVAVQAEGADKAKHEVEIKSDEAITKVDVDVETPAEADKAKK